MGEIVYCSVCGERIVEKDFEKGKAVTILQKNYCPRCAEGVVRANAEPGKGRERGKTSSPRKLQIRPPLKEPEPQVKRSPLSTPTAVAILIGIAALALLALALGRGGR